MVRLRPSPVLRPSRLAKLALACLPSRPPVKMKKSGSRAVCPGPALVEKKRAGGGGDGGLAALRSGVAAPSVARASDGQPGSRSIVFVPV